MQKNSITNKITPCCGLPFSVVYWWVSNLTLNSESDRQFILSKISQNGTISIDGWKVLVNSGTLEADASLTKAEFLAWFDCKKQPKCEQLKLIIEGYKLGVWVGDLNEIRFENVLGVIKITDTAPTTVGLYRLADVGTYTNLGGLVTTSGKINDAYFNGTTWSKVEVAMPIVDVENTIADISRNNQKTFVNLYDSSTISTKGKWANYLSGFLQSSTDGYPIEDIRRSDFIPVKGNTKYSRIYGGNPIIGDVGSVFYDSAKNYLGYTFDRSFTTSEDTAFVILNISDSDYLYESLVLGGIIPNRSVVKTSVNLYDRNSLSPINKWVNYNTGIVESYPTNQYIPGYHYASPISVKPSTVYTRIYGSAGTSFFDAQMNFISGTNTSTFTTPPNTRYVVMNVLYYQSFEQLEEGNKSTTYVAFGKNVSSCEIILPNKIYSVIGRETNIYLDNIMIDHAEKYDYRIECPIGFQQQERFTVVPSVVGTSQLTIDVYGDTSDEIDVLSSFTTNIVVAAQNAVSGEKKYMQIGDSTTFQLNELGCLQAAFSGDSMTLNQLGTQGVSPNKSEGYPGKDTQFIFSDPTSPFVFSGSFNFAQYMSTNGYSGVDAVGFAMGINDMYPMRNDAQVNEKIALNFSYYDAMIASVKAYNPNIKIGIFCPILPTKSQDAFGEASAQSRFRHKRSMMLWNKALIKKYQNREGENIFVVPYATSLDCVNNFDTYSVAVNSRNSKLVSRQGNALHPNESGYLQMADTIRAWLKNVL